MCVYISEVTGRLQKFLRVDPAWASHHVAKLWPEFDNRGAAHKEDSFFDPSTVACNEVERKLDRTFAHHDREEAIDPVVVG